ncbi:MAG: hypothetical protein AABY86_04995 [Bdellovibrionota bacterium]
MRYVSTRNGQKKYLLSEVLKMGICPVGGLFVPESLPKFNDNFFDRKDDYLSFSEKLLHPFFE